MSAIRLTAIRFFARLSLREKLLTIVFIAVMWAIWANYILGGLTTWRERHSAADAEIQVQDQWLARQAEFQERLDDSLARFDPQRTYDGAQLTGRIDALLREAKLATSADIDPVRTQEGEIFDENNLRLRISKISMKDLIQLNSLLLDESPYITLESMRIDPDKRRRELLDVRLELSSIELGKFSTNTTP